MSDFDKEAEREKLREKYEREEEKREATEQMSELLLKGATMTNAHCGDCGDPIFRYDGQEFCPTCQKPVDRETGDGADGQEGTDAESGTNGASDGNIEVTTPSDDASVRFGGDEAAGASSEPAGESGDRSPDEPGQQPPAGGTTATNPDDAHAREGDGSETVRQVPSADPGPTPDHRTGSPTGTTAAERRTGGSAADHLESAQLLLARTLERYASLAAEADSPRDARDHLETAREAAETLDATQF